MLYNPYFLFDGKAEEAINLYEKAFGGTPRIIKYKDAPKSEDFQPPVELLERVMHGELRFNNLVFMICDSSPMSPVTNGNNVQVSINFDTKEEFTKAFDVLKDGAKVLLPPSETFFAEYYTTFEDKFGVTWQFLLLKAH